MLIWTRSASNWITDQNLFSLPRPQILSFPCIEERSLPIDSSFSFQKGVIVFTSALAVRFFAENPLLFPIFSGSSILSVGKETQRKLSEFGIPSVVPENCKSSQDLGDYIGDHISLDQPILLPGAQTRSFPLDVFLEEKGYGVETLDLYETLILREGDVPSSQGVVCFASPSAVHGFFSRFRKGTYLFLTIGEATEKALRRYAQKGKVISEPSLSLLAKEAEACLKETYGIDIGSF